MIRPHYVGVYQSVCTSEKVAALKGHASRVFFYQLLTHVDSWGRTEASASTLLGLVWPLLGETVKSTEAAIQDLARVGLVRLYEVGGKRYLQVEQHERFGAKVGRPDKRGNSIWPDPPAESGGLVGKNPDHSPLARASDRIGSDRKEGMQGEGEADAPPPGPHELAAYTKLDTEPVRAAWTRWEKHRREIRHPLGDTGRETILKGYAARCERGEDGAAALVVDIDHTITKGWQGLASPDRPRNGHESAGPPPKPAAQRKADESRQADERAVERAWNAKHATTIEVEILGEKRRVPGLDAKYPGHEAAKAELERKAAS